MRVKGDENAKNLRILLTGIINVHNLKDVRSYYIEISMDTFEAVVTSFYQRFEEHPAILVMEEYQTNTDSKQCITSIDTIVGYVDGELSKEKLDTTLSSLRNASSDEPCYRST